MLYEHAISQILPPPQKNNSNKLDLIIAGPLDEGVPVGRKEPISYEAFAMKATTV